MSALAYKAFQFQQVSHITKKNLKTETEKMQSDLCCEIKHDLKLWVKKLVNAFGINERPLKNSAIVLQNTCRHTAHET